MPLSCGESHFFSNGGADVKVARNSKTVQEGILVLTMHETTGQSEMAKP